MDSPVFQVINERTGEIVYTLRSRQNAYRPGVFTKDAYTVRVGDPDSNEWEVLSGLKGTVSDSGKGVEVIF